MDNRETNEEDFANNKKSKDRSWFKELKVDRNELTLAHELKFYKTVQEYENVFARDESNFGFRRLIEHEINT